ncbi:MAG TPA: chalcone isomerase family protein [Kofleriaceae bacterium]|nr:chalcone isomerase family protein [Kofleriaceae bacterium]
MGLTKVLLIALAVTSGVARGADAPGSMPNEITVAGRSLVLNGTGLRVATFLHVHVYVAGLYVEHPSSDPVRILASREAKRLVMHFVRHVDHDDIVKAWNEGFRSNATVPIAQIQPMIDQLDAWTPTFHDGDTLTFTYVPGMGVSVDYNGVRKGVIASEDFARSLFAVWLGPKPPTEELKRGLLGHHPEAR